MRANQTWPHGKGDAKAGAGGTVCALAGAAYVPTKATIPNIVPATRASTDKPPRMGDKCRENRRRKGNRRLGLSYAVASFQPFSWPQTAI